MLSDSAVYLWIAEIPVCFFFWNAERWEVSLFQCSREIAAAICTAWSISNAADIQIRL